MIQTVVWWLMGDFGNFDDFNFGKLCDFGEFPEICLGSEFWINWAILNNHM